MQTFLNRKPRKGSEHPPPILGEWVVRYQADIFAITVIELLAGTSHDNKNLDLCQNSSFTDNDVMTSVLQVAAGHKRIALNLHIHILFIDGVFSPKSNDQLRFHRVNAPTSKELNALVATIRERVARYLECQGRPARVGRPSDEQSDHLTLALDDEEGNTMQQLLRSLDQQWLRGGY